MAERSVWHMLYYCPLRSSPVPALGGHAGGFVAQTDTGFSHKGSASSLFPTANFVASPESCWRLELAVGPGSTLLSLKRPDCSLIKHLSKLQQENPKALLWRIEMRNVLLKC